MKKITILLFCFLTLSAKGQILDDYLIIAAENYPGLRAKFQEYHASLQRIPQASALPDPQVSFGIFVMPMERYMGDQVAEVSLMQMFPWFGTPGAARNEAALMAKARFEIFNEARSMLFYEVKATWYALYLLEKEIAITEENVRILRSLEEMALARFKSGGGGEGRNMPQGNRMKEEKTDGRSGGMGNMKMEKPASSASSSAGSGMGAMNDMGRSGGMVDVLRVQMEINELSNSLALLKDTRKPLQSRFNQLLNRPSGEAAAVPDSIIAAELPLPAAQIPDSIRTNNPMLRMLEKEEEAFRAQEVMSRKMGFPMIGLGMQYEIFRPRPGGESMMNGRNMLMPMATVSIPLWRKKYNASVKEAGFMREAAAEQKKETENQLLVSYEEALKDFNDAKRRIDLFRKQTELAQQALNILIVQYTTAGLDFEEVLRMQQTLLNYRLKGLDAVVDANVAAAMVERLMGR